MADDDFSGFGTDTAVQESQVSDTSDTSTQDFSGFGTEADTFKISPDFVSGKGTRNNAKFNNPGALGPGPSATEFGGYASGQFDTGHAFMAFPSAEAGAAAQFRLWQNTRLYQGHTLADAIKSWIGPGEHGEAEFIASKLGIPLDTVISEDFLKGPQGIALMKAQATYEGENALTDEQWANAQKWAYEGQKPSAQNVDFSGFGSEKEDKATAQDPRGEADFFLKRGDQPITNSNDPRLTTVKVGNQSWQVNKEAAPYFQGFLNDLAKAGAPVNSAGGWNYRNIAGTNKLSEHAWGGAIDVNQTGRDVVTPEFKNWIAQHPGVLQELENKWHIYGGERFGDLGHFEWGGVGQGPAAQEGAKKDDFSDFGTEGKADVPQGTKETPKKAGNAFTDFWNNLFGTAGQTGFGLDVAKAKEDLNRALNEEKKPTLFGAEQEKEDQALKNPNISQADAEEIIEKRRQRTEMDKEIAQRQLKRAQDAQAKAESIEPGPAYQRTIPGKISSFLGSAAPYLLSGSLGAAAPITVATQMSEQAYGDTFDRGMKQGRAAHPDWSEERLRQEADKAARAAAQTGFENGVVMGLLPVPKVGPLVAQLVQRIGMRGAYMVIASASQDIEENIQIKKGVDQNQSIYEGVLKHVPANLLAGMAFEAPGAITEAVRARGGAPERAVPQEQAPRVEQQREPTLKGPPPAEPPPTEPKVSTEDPDQWVSAIANRYSQERSARGEIGEVAPGQGYATTDLIRVGERMKPEEINQHISDLMHDTGDPKLQAAAVRVEEARLSERSSRLSRIAENNPADAQAKINADNAFNDLTDFHNGPVAKLKNNWHAQGMTLQGEVPVDLGSFNGLREAWLREIGTQPSAEVESKMRDTAKRVREAAAAEEQALRKVGQEAVKSSLEKRLARAEEVKRNIMERLKDDPCL